MKLATIPKSMANQEMDYITLSDETDIYGRPQKKIQHISNVVVQQEPVYTGTNNNRELVANAVVFLYWDVTTPMPTLTTTNVGDKVKFEDHEYTVQRIVENRQPFSNDIWSYEVEVL